MAFEDLHTHYVTDAIELPPAADLVTMLNDGATYDDLAEIFECSASTIRTRITNSELRDKTPPTTTPTTAPAPTLLVRSLPTWMADARCVDIGPEIFFPEDGVHGGKGSGYATQAKAICAHCPVRQDCLNYALDFESGAMGTRTSYAAAGVYGGLSPRERIRLLRDRAAELEAS